MPKSLYWRTVLSPTEPLPRCEKHHVHARKDLLTKEKGKVGVSSLTNKGEKPRYPPKRFKCSNCTTVFRQRSHLNAHFKVVHMKIKPYKCEHCDLAFGKRYDLESHRAAVHNNVRPHTCKFCSRRFAKRSNLIRHGNRLHSHLMPRE